MKLHLLVELNHKFPEDAGRREAARRWHQARTIAESREPQQGIFWWAPRFNEDKSIRWVLIEFFESEYGYGIDHQSIWEKWAATILGVADTKLSPILLDAYCCIPRGRVSKELRSTGRYLVLHGNDAPVKNAVRSVASRFNLPQNNYCGLFDDHERTIREHVRTIERFFGRSLGFKKPASVADFM